MERWDVYDIEKSKTGRTIARMEPLGKGEFTLVAFVCVFNSKNEMLIQQRQSTKRGWPDQWEISAGGAVMAGETSRIAAERETWEEIGLKVDLKDTRACLTVCEEHCFIDIYLTERDVELSSLRLQKEEVQAVKWANQEEILAMIESGKFVPFYPSLIGYLFDQRKHFGWLSK